MKCQNRGRLFSEFCDLVVLALRVFPLQYIDTILFEIISKALFLPTFKTDKFLFNFVVGRLVSFECHFGKD